MLLVNFDQLDQHPLTQGLQESRQHSGHFRNHLRETLDDLAAMQVRHIVSDRLGAQHVFAFGIDLQGQSLKVNLENSHVIHRILNHAFVPRRGIGASPSAILVSRRSSSPS